MLDYLAENGGGALFVEMRLGKTLVAIRYAQNIVGKKLVVCPTEGLWTWKRELEMEQKSYVVLRGTKEQRLVPSKAEWHLINYESLLATPELLGRVWSMIVVDESRRMANPKAKVTRLLNSLPITQHRIVLSGEPAPESPLEYFEQLKFVNGNFMGAQNYWQFRNNNFREFGPHDWVMMPSKINRFKENLHEKSFILSRKQAGIPDKKIYEVRTLPLPPALRKTYDEVRKDFLASINGSEISTKWVPVQYLWLHQISCGFLGEKLLWEGKVKSLLELLRGELAHEQVVVWFRFNAAIDLASRLLLQSSVQHARIVGAETRANREESINRFRSGELRVLLCQIKCGRSSIDLSNSSTAVYFSNSYSLEDRHQSEDRILNPVKKDPLLYIDLVTEKTVEEDILETLRLKGAEAKYFMSNLMQKLRAA